MTTPEITVAAALAGARFTESLLALSPQMHAIVARAAIDALLTEAAISGPNDRAALIETLASAVSYLTELKPEARPASGQLY